MNERLLDMWAAFSSDELQAVINTRLHGLGGGFPYEPLSEEPEDLVVWVFKELDDDFRNRARLALAELLSVELKRRVNETVRSSDDEYLERLVFLAGDVKAYEARKALEWALPLLDYRGDKVAPTIFWGITALIKPEETALVPWFNQYIARPQMFRSALSAFWKIGIKFAVAALPAAMKTAHETGEEELLVGTLTILCAPEEVEEFMKQVFASEELAKNDELRGIVGSVLMKMPQMGEWRHEIRNWVNVELDMAGSRS